MNMYICKKTEQNNRAAPPPPITFLDLPLDLEVNSKLFIDTAVVQSLRQ